MKGKKEASDSDRESGEEKKKSARSHHVNSLKHRIEMEEAVAMAAEAASFC